MGVPVLNHHSYLERADDVREVKHSVHSSSPSHSSPMHLNQQNQSQKAKSSSSPAYWPASRPDIRKEKEKSDVEDAIIKVPICLFFIA
jgi:hypothetical protein